jgi:hypothetical protein
VRTWELLFGSLKRFRASILSILLLLRDRFKLRNRYWSIGTYSQEPLILPDYFRTEKHGVESDASSAIGEVLENFTRPPGREFRAIAYLVSLQVFADPV